MPIKRICVYCGSSLGLSPVYQQAAEHLAICLVEHDYELVYGGAQVGIMGQLADAVLSHGGRVIGVIPQSLLQKEIGHQALSELVITISMHERKQRMEQLSDGFIALPGGLGTLEELFEIWTWGQLHFHHKPFGVLNIAGYYDPLLAFLDHATHQGFIRPAQRNLLLQANRPEDLLKAFVSYTAPTAESGEPKRFDQS